MSAQKKVDSRPLYRRFYEAYKDAHPKNSNQKNQDEANECWRAIRDDKNCVTLAEERISVWLQQATKNKASVLHFFTSLRPSKPKITRPASSSNETHSDDNKENQKDFHEDQKDQNTVSLKTSVRETPAQDLSQKKINYYKTELNSLLLDRDAGIAQIRPEEKIRQVKTNLDEENKTLKRKRDAAERQKKCRNLKKQKFDSFADENPEIAGQLSIRRRRRRPRIEEDQPELLRVISEIALFGGAAADRRRSEIIRSCRTLDDLHDELLNGGFKISHSGVYLRLLPKNGRSIQGKRHVVTVPVKLSAPESDHHANHPDGHFCVSTIRALESLASVLGLQQVFFWSQDDKARVPLGITAAKAQAPILMRMDYCVRLPDHDFVVAEKRKLIPSVYAVINIRPDGIGQPDDVTYSGPTYVAIRSGKHCSSTAETHAADLETLVDRPAIQSFAKTTEGRVKPVFICTSDGGPDENPRYPRVIASAIKHFKAYDLDIYYIATNAPGRSAFNRVERRMAPLSRELTGVILKHDTFGTHLNSQNETVDGELEKRNFEHAGKVLADIWTDLVIDEYTVEAEYIGPNKHPKAAFNVDAEWYAKHVRESQYCLQIAKCDSQKCCGVRRSSIWTLLPDGFLPPPVLVKQTSQGYSAVNTKDNQTKFCPLLLQTALKLQAQDENWDKIPYDYHCPSLQNDLPKRVCKKCGLYFASMKSAVLHARLAQKKKGTLDKSDVEVQTVKVRPRRIAAERARELFCIMNDDLSDAEEGMWFDEDEVDQSHRPNFGTRDENLGMPVIGDIDSWFTSTWKNK